MPYVCLRRTDVPPGVVQVLDLWPNTSLKTVYEPVGQTGYISHRPDNDTVSTSVGRVTLSGYSGVAAYLLDNIVSGGEDSGTGALSDADANEIADDLVDAMSDGDPMTLANVNAIIDNVVSDTSLGGGGSTGVLSELLRILSGEVYTVPSGSDMEVGGTKTARLGSFASLSRIRRFYDGVSFQASAHEGQLAGFKSDDFVYVDVAGALLVIYDDSGNVV